MRYLKIKRHITYFKLKKFYKKFKKNILNELILSLIYNDKIIKEAINSRSNLSVFGPDRISNWILKIGNIITTEIIKHTNEITSIFS